jgi:hypothetical protein
VEAASIINAGQNTRRTAFATVLCLAQQGEVNPVVAAGFEVNCPVVSLDHTSEASISEQPPCLFVPIRWTPPGIGRPGGVHSGRLLSDEPYM